MAVCRTTEAAIQATWDAAAAGWDDNGPLIRQWLREATIAMLDAADIQRSHQVLDVAAGAGDQTIDIARRIGPTGSVLAVDLSPELVTRARSNFACAGLNNAEARVGNGQSLGLQPSFDAAICRLGLMFYGNPLAGLIEMRRALKPGGRAAVLVFSGPERNQLIVEQLTIAARHAKLPPIDPSRPGGLLSLGSSTHLMQLFKQAGFRQVDFRTIDAPMNLPSARDYVDFLRTAAGPILQIAERLSSEQRADLWKELEQAFANPRGDVAAWRGENELLLVSGSVVT